MKEKTEAKTLFECSWEVCNKVGGIYTVVKSKAALMNDAYENYFLVGPYFEDKAMFETMQKVPSKKLKKVFDALALEGIMCIYAKWHIKGTPDVILINFSNMPVDKNEIKKYLWEKFAIDSLFSAGDFDEPMLWSYAVSRLIKKYSEEFGDEKIVSHFHEWLAGIALLYLKDEKNIATTFTTHATMLGRSIAGGGEDLYEMLDSLNPDEEARKKGIMDKYSTEVACAKNADVFTTVSEITGMEAEKILGRKPDVLVLNGLDIEKFPTFEEVSVKHRQNRKIIRRFLKTFFLPYYELDLDENLIFFIVGRYEFKNKGLDIFIKALSRLNVLMKEEDSKHTITVLFWIPSETHGVKSEILENEDNYRQLVDFIERHHEIIRENIENSVLSGKEITNDTLVDEDFILETKRLRMMFKKEGLPPLVTNVIFNEESDPILRAFKDGGLLNREEDKVKVIFYPVYLTGADNLISLKYYDAIVGCHMGIFPSYYEPWGYTPLESAAFGVPAITTDNGGFGRFIKQKLANTSDKDASGTKREGGIFVLDRFKRNEHDVISDFVKILHDYTKLSKKDRVKQKMRAKELTSLCDWSELADNYIIAHNLALKKHTDKL